MMMAGLSLTGTKLGSIAATIDMHTCITSQTPIVATIVD